jgi:hypothetical protein
MILTVEVPPLVLEVGVGGAARVGLRWRAGLLATLRQHQGRVMVVQGVAVMQRLGGSVGGNDNKRQRLIQETKYIPNRFLFDYMPLRQHQGRVVVVQGVTVIKRLGGSAGGKGEDKGNEKEGRGLIKDTPREAYRYP